MNTDFKPRFLRAIKKITDVLLLEVIEQVICSVEEAKTVKDIPELKKLKGYKEGIYYRIKLGDYRIGVTIENDLVTFVVFRHRKDIYKSFP